MANNISSKLKEMRKKSGFSVDDVCAHLKECGFEISTKTMYSYESGYRMPNADVFLALCVHYGCFDVLFDFVYSTKRMYSSSVSSEEQEILDKYNELPEGGKDMIRGALGLEKGDAERKREIS